jgi:hypothetical protein
LKFSSDLDFIRDDDDEEEKEQKEEEEEEEVEEEDETVGETVHPAMINAIIITVLPEKPLKAS